MRGFVAVLALVFLGGCAIGPVINKESETKAFIADIGVQAQYVKLTSRCNFAMAPKGAVAAPELLQGVCFVSDRGLHIRVIDITTGKSEHLVTIKPEEIESISRVPHALYEQLQVRMRAQIIALYMRPDGGFGLNWDASNKFVESVKSLGVREIEATGRIEFRSPGGSDGGAVIPIFIPRGR